MTTAFHRVAVSDVDAVEVTVSDIGAGQTFLLLHGGAGPQSVQPFAQTFAAAYDVRVLVPIHPGFGGTARPHAFTRIAQLAELYTQLLEDLELEDVTVVGNSVGDGSPSKSRCGDLRGSPESSCSTQWALMFRVIPSPTSSP